MSTTQIGKIGFVLKGAWNSTTAYNNLDVVLYNNNSYAAKGTVPVNTNPTNTTYWQKITDISSLPISNINLLTNAYFFGRGSHVSGEYFPLNTLGKNLYDGTGNDCIDNWMVKGSAAQFRFSSGWTAPHIRSTTTNLDGAIRQKLPYILPNGTYTFSALIQNSAATGEDVSSVTTNRVTIIIRDQNNNALSSSSSTTTGLQLLTTTFTQNYSAENPVYIGSVEIATRAITSDATMRITVAKDVVLRAAKLEYGDQQSLAYLDNNSWKIIEIPTYKDTLTTTKFNNVWDIHTKGKIIFMGNSYTDNSDTWRNWDHWPRHVARILNLGEEEVNWWNIGKGGWSLANTDTTKRFIVALQTWVSGHPNNISEIGAIVLVAGINDARTERISSISSCFSELATYIKSTFPNASYYNGYCGWIDEYRRAQYASDDSHGGVFEMAEVFKAYTYAEAYGWRYLNGVENIFHNRTLFCDKSNGTPDHIHPNSTGQNLIGRGVANALITGACSVDYNYSSNYSNYTGTTPAAAGSVNYTARIYTNNNTPGTGWLKEQLHNNVVYSKLTIDIQFLTPNTTTPLGIRFRSGESYVLGKVTSRLSNTIEFGEQTVFVVNSDNTRSLALIRLVIQPSGYIIAQVRAFADGTVEHTITRIARGYYTNTEPVYAPYE